MFGCRCCTWERASLQGLAFLSSAAFALSVASVVSCRFFEVVSTVEAAGSVGGLFRVSYRHDECIKWDDLPDENITFTASTKAARGFGIMAIIFGSVCTALLLLMQCTLQPTYRSVWKFTGYTAMASFVSQAFTFLVYKQVKDVSCNDDEFDCKLGIGAILSVCATILYLLTGCVVLLVVRKPPTTTAHQCNLLNNFLQQIANKSGIHLKKDIWQSLRSITWVQGCVLFISLVSFLFSVTVVFDCRLVKTSFLRNEWQLGLYYYFYTPDDTCRTYEYGDRQSFYTSTKAAQVFGVIALFAGLVLLLLLCAMAFLDFPNPIRKALPYLAFLSGLSQALTFLCFKEAKDRLCQLEEQSCKLGTDAILAIIATVFYLGLVPALCCCSGAIENQSDHHDEPVDEKSSEIVDGAKEEEAAAGSEALEESIEKADKEEVPT